MIKGQVGDEIGVNGSHKLPRNLGFVEIQTASFMIIAVQSKIGKAERELQ